MLDKLHQVQNCISCRLVRPKLFKEADQLRNSKQPRFSSLTIVNNTTERTVTASPLRKREPALLCKVNKFTSSNCLIGQMMIWVKFTVEDSLLIRVRGGSKLTTKKDTSRAWPCQQGKIHSEVHIPTLIVIHLRLRSFKSLSLV